MILGPVLIAEYLGNMHQFITFWQLLVSPKGRSCRGTIWEVVTQLSNFLAVTTSLPDRFGVFQDSFQNGVFISANRIFTAV